MQTVYDAEGKPYTIEPVDAREWLRSGYYFATPPGAAEDIPAVITEIIDKGQKPPLIPAGAVESGASQIVTGAELFSEAAAKVRGKPGPKPKA
jgi:hypothetical protein